MQCVSGRERTICNCKKKIDVSFSWVCPVIDNEFHHNVAKVICRSIACVASVSVRFGSKQLQGAKWSDFFGSRSIFRACKIPKIPFLGLSLLPNLTETLATQHATQASRFTRLSLTNI